MSNEEFTETVEQMIIKVWRLFFLIVQTPLPEQEGPSSGLLSNFELMSSKDVAYHMTSYDWELFHCVHEVWLWDQMLLPEWIYSMISPRQTAFNSRPVLML